MAKCSICNKKIINGIWGVAEHSKTCNQNMVSIKMKITDYMNFKKFINKKNDEL